MKTAAVVVVSLLLLCATCVACGTRATRNDTSNSPSKGSTTSPTQSPPPVTSAPPVPVEPFQKGIQVYWHETPGGVGDFQRANKLLDYVVSLGANAVGINFPIYTDGIASTGVFVGDETPSTETLGVVLQAAKQRGLRVMFRPIIDEENLRSQGAWRGKIQPVGVNAWFESYDNLIESYLPLLKEYDIDEYVVGVELFSMQPYKDQWSRLRSAIQQAGYQGEVSYSLNWNKFSPDMPFDILGIDAYPNIALGDDATVDELTQALTAWFDRQPLDVRKKITIQEAGIPAQSGMYEHPWMWGQHSPLDEQIQANWFTAMCSAAHGTNVRGLYFWMLNSTTNFDDPSGQSAINWAGRPAADSIRTCFTQS